MMSILDTIVKIGRPFFVDFRMKRSLGNLEMY